MSGSEEPPADYFRLVGVRLYQPDAVLKVRLAGGTARLASYVQTLTWVGTEYFGRLQRDLGSLGILIVVGVKPPDRITLWCETVNGDLPGEVWETFVRLLNGAGSNVRPQVVEPVAFAIEATLGDGPGRQFPEVPAAWLDALRGERESVGVPDGIFRLVFPD